MATLNTTNILKALERGTLGDLPGRILAGAAIVKDSVARLNETSTNTEQDARTLAVINATDANLSILESSQTTMSAREEHLKNLLPLKVNAIEQHDKRAELMENVKNFIPETQRIIKEVAQALAEKGNKAAFLSQAPIQQLMQTQQTLRQSALTIEKNELAVFEELKKLNDKMAIDIASKLKAKPATPSYNL